MAIIKTPRQKTIPPKRIALSVPFDLWNELIASGEPRVILEELLDGWYRNRVADRDNYLISNNAKVLNLKLAPITQLEIDYAERLLNEARALGHNRKAALLEVRLEALRENYIPPDEEIA
jgi:hypothetical protein